MFPTLPSYLKIYLLIYSLLIFAAALLILKNRTRYGLFTADYWRFLFTPYKISILFLGVLALALPVPYLNLHSWDRPIAVFQPILAYLTAPWTVAALYRSYKGRCQWDETFVAIILVLFTGSWAVEIYLLCRDGYYMPDYLLNIPIEIICYLAIGFIWNIEWVDGQGHYSFIDKPK